MTMFKKMKYFSPKVKVTKVAKNIMLAALGILLIGLGGCTMTRTPEIRGLVLDRETWRPVPDAWIHAQLGLELVTIAGRGNDLLSLDSPHTRTNEKGEFFIPARDFQSPFFPFILKKNYYYFGVSADTLDDRMGEYRIGPWGWKSRIDVTLYVEPWKEFLLKNREKLFLGSCFHYVGSDNLSKPVDYEEAYFSYLATLEHYCFGGRLHYEKPAVQGGCDEWELNYAIFKYEKFLEKLKKPKTVDQESILAVTMHRIAYLYKRNKNYEKALEIFKAALSYARQRGVKMNQLRYEKEIKELEQLIQNQKK
jgi:tetratricopeptide (TPR) repeat protein